MSFILPRFAERSDLSTFDKIHFSLDTRVEESEWARAFYRAVYRGLPAWLSVSLLVFCVFAVMPVLIPVIGIGSLFEDCDEWFDNGVGEALGLLSVLAGIIGVYTMLIYQSLWCWLLVPAGIISLLAFWFGILMDDYARELDRLEKKVWSPYCR